MITIIKSNLSTLYSVLSTNIKSKLCALYLVLGTSVLAVAEEVAKSGEKAKAENYWQFLIDAKPEMIFATVMIFFLAVLTLVASILAITAIRLVYYPDTAQEGLFESMWKGFEKKYVNAHKVAIEDEEQIMLDHDYDGIKELDNFMPPWLQWIFFGTIIFAVAYSVMIFSTGDIKYQKEEYEESIAQAEKDKEAYLAKQANSIDENTVKIVKDKPALLAGKTVFDQNCKTCHGAVGEGGAGPNLTDKFWIHGGKVNDIFKTIKYGVPGKPMPEWQKKLKPIDIQNVSGYILSLQGTNPANAKEAQGVEVK